MKTKNASPACNVVLAALFLALAFVLPMVTGHLPQVGNMLCPMHFPILLYFRLPVIYQGSRADYQRRMFFLIFFSILQT